MEIFRYEGEKKRFDSRFQILQDRHIEDLDTCDTAIAEVTIYSY